MNKKVKYILFWALYALFIFMIYSVLTETLEAFFRTLGMISMQLCVYLVNTKYLLPAYFHKKKYISYGLTNLLLLLFSVFIIDFLIRLSYYISHLDREHEYTMGTIFNYKGFNIASLEIIFNHAMPVLLAIFISFLYYNFLQQKKREEEKMLLAKAEKDFLISQINPHFLFNTLNNIYSLTKSNDNKGSEAVMQLSKMLDYSLYDSNKEAVSLKSEIEYISNFIALFKLKDDEIDKVDFSYNNANPAFRIAPMLLIPFVENAFKHGNIEDINKGYISVILKTKNNTVSFICENSFIPKKSVDASSGIGITNVKRRLELLYPNQHQLSIEKTANNYKINLLITIDEA